MDRQRTQEQNERRAAYLRGKIERAQAEIESLGQPSTRLATGPNILVGVPCFGGLLHWRTAISLMNLTQVLSRSGIRASTHFVANESLITRARNHLASVAAFSTDTSGRPWSHVLFVDADISFEPEGALKMLDAKRPIVALPYSRKSVNWRRVATAAISGVPPEALADYAGSPVL